MSTAHALNKRCLIGFSRYQIHSTLSRGGGKTLKTPIEMALSVLFLFIVYGLLCLSFALPIKNSVQGQTKVDVRESGLVQSDKLIILDPYIRPLVRSKRQVIKNGRCSKGHVWCRGKCRTVEM